MTPKERRLVFVYSKLCDLDDILNHCIRLLFFDGFDKEDGIEDDERISKLRGSLGGLSGKLETLKDSLGLMVNETTDYSSADSKDQPSK